MLITYLVNFELNMKKVNYYLLAFIFLFNLQINGQGKYNIGDKISTFSLTNVVNNSNVNLSDFGSSKALVLIFTNTECPYSKLYEDRLINMANTFKDKNLEFVLVNPTPVSTSDNLYQLMSKRAKEKNYPFPFLADSKASISNLFGATKTPEAFVLKSSNGSFYLAYKGAIDDNPQVANDVTHFYLKDALNDIIANQSVKISEKRPSGCMIPVN